MTVPSAVFDALFTSLDPPLLAGARCAGCGTVTFPVQSTCPRCTRTDMQTVPLPDRGTLWTFTVQSFEPKAPYLPPAAGFVDYGVGYIDLGDVIIESRLEGDLDRLQIGAPMRLTLLQPWSDQNIVTFAFEEH